MATRKYLAEFVGTFLLVFLAVGAAVFGIAASVGVNAAGAGAGVLGISLAFGLVLFALAYALGPISGAHVNPAVTLAMVLAGRMSFTEAIGYWVAQFVGGIVGGGLLSLFVNVLGATDTTGGLGTNGYDNGSINLAGALILETILTASFVLVILLVTEKQASSTMAGASIGFALAAVNLVGIPLTGTSVNPARSLGPAIFAGGEAMAQVWVFVTAPLLGAVVAWLLWRLLREETAAA